jgi:hypothetical protein
MMAPCLIKLALSGKGRPAVYAYGMPVEDKEKEAKKEWGGFTRQS